MVPQPAPPVISEEISERLIGGLMQETPPWFRPAQESPGGLAEAVGALQLKDFHREILKAAITHPRLVVLIFRGAGKTTLGSGYLPAWLLGHNRNARICLGCHSLELARLNLEFISQIMQHPRYRYVFGNLVPPSRTLTWNDTAKFVLGRDPVRHKDPSLYALGYDGSALGHRVDWLILDDLVELKNSRTPALRAWLELWFFLEVLPLVEPPELGGHVILFGTRGAPDDLYSVLQERGWRVLEVPVRDPRTGSSIWPERYSDGYLADLERERGRFFASQYLLKPVSGSALVFAPELLPVRRVDPGAGGGLGEVCVGVDPATSLSRSADRFAAVVAGAAPCVHGDAHPHDIIVLEGLAGRFSLDQQQEVLKQLASRWRASVVNIEQAGAQSYLIQGLDSILPVRASPSRLPKELRFEMLDELLRSGRVYLRAAESVEPHPDLGPLLEELSRYPSRRDDLIDALEKAVEPLLYGGPPAAMASSGPGVSVIANSIQQRVRQTRRWFGRSW
jgi:hypothetical protein